MVVSSEAQWASRYIEGRIPYPNDISNLIIDRCKTNCVASLVDVGSGPGWLTAQLTERKINVVAIEPCEFFIHSHVYPENCTIYKSIDKYISHAFSPDNAYIFSQVLHIIPRNEIARLIEKQDSRIINAVIWVDRYGQSQYDEAVDILRDEFNIPTSIFNNYYGMIETELSEIGLTIIDGSELKYSAYRNAKQLAYYLLSQSHVNSSLDEAFSLKLISKMSEIISSELCELKFNVRIAFCKK